MPQVRAIVLAAGLSRRMNGQNKLLLPYGEVTVIQAVVQALRRCPVDIVVVTGRDADQVAYAAEHGLSLTAILTIDDLVKGDDVFFAASGVTTGDLLKGVEYFAGGARSESFVMRSRSGTIRRITTEHHWRKLQEITGERYTT